MGVRNKILTLQQAEDFANECRNADKKIVFSNGCFDLLHKGHVDYLEKAAGFGDVLMLGLNSDASIKIIKGENRPIVDESGRARVMAALGFIDAVILFDKPTPESLIMTIRPDILVKGSDYEIENIVGSDFVIKNGGRVETIDLVDGYSTSDIINKIKNS